MISVHKYRIPFSDDILCDMPEGAEILHVALQGETPCIWAKVDTCRPLESRTFRMVETGRELDDRNYIHLGTFLMEGGALVFHVFEVCE